MKTRSLRQPLISDAMVPEILTIRRELASAPRAQSGLRQRLIDEELLAPTQDEPPYLTPIQLPAGTRVFRIDPAAPAAVPYKVRLS